MGRNCRLCIALLSYIAYLCFGAMCFQAIEWPYRSTHWRYIQLLKTTFLKKNMCVIARRRSMKAHSVLCCGLLKTDLLFVAYLGFYIVYLCVGAVLFSLMETPGELQDIYQFQASRQQFLLKYPNISDDDLEKFVADVIKASTRGISPLNNATVEAKWSFGQSLFFSGTVVTTIGYGHITPLSQAGKAFCIVYAIFGIPFTLVLLSALVERILVPIVWLLELLNAKLSHLYKPFNIRLLHLSIVSLFVIATFLLLPAAVFTLIESEWDYLDSLYYCFISLTTIGLGDYIPGDEPDQRFRTMYKIGITVYLIVGITFIMAVLAVFYDIPQLNLGVLFSGSETDAECMRLVPSYASFPKRDDDPKINVKMKSCINHKQRPITGGD